MVTMFWKIMAVNREIIKNENGQSLVEFLIFLPFLLIMYIIISTFVNAINGSINQLKATRNYYFVIYGNDSKLPDRSTIEGIHSSDTLSQFGLFSLGWATDLRDKRPVATCYKMFNFSGTKSEETCDPGIHDFSPTKFVRVKTSFGTCTVNYRWMGNYFLYWPKSDYTSCTNF